MGGANVDCVIDGSDAPSGWTVSLVDQAEVLFDLDPNAEEAKAAAESAVGADSPAKDD
jgi:hypothetical protein